MNTCVNLLNPISFWEQRLYAHLVVCLCMKRNFKGTCDLFTSDRKYFVVERFINLFKKIFRSFSISVVYTSHWISSTKEEGKKEKGKKRKKGK